MFGGGPSFNPDTDISDLSGKVVFVTGGMEPVKTQKSKYF